MSANLNDLLQLSFRSTVSLVVYCLIKKSLNVYENVRFSFKNAQSLQSVAHMRAYILHHMRIFKICALRAHKHFNFLFVFECV